MSTPSRSLFVSVGELSADQHASRVLSELRRMAPDLHAWGVGGPQMQSQGVELLHDCQTLACFGIVEVLRFLPRLARIKMEMLAEIENRSPDAVLLVDFGGFNLRLAQAIRKRHKDLPIIYFISPQVWGSRPWRINTIAKTMSKMLVIFPFEERLYLDKGVDARFVGHPLAQQIEGERHSFDRTAFLTRYGLSAERPLIGVFPGSRRQEIEDLGPVVLKAIQWLAADNPQLQFGLSQASPALAQSLEKVIDRNGFRPLVGKALTLVSPADSRELMGASDLVWAKSGTTTLEAALLGKPMLIFYRGNWVSYLIFLIFKRVQNVGWPNILAGRQVVPELIQLDCRPEQLVRYTRDWLEVPGFQKEVSAVLTAVRNRLGEGDFAVSAAREILAILEAPLESTRDPGAPEPSGSKEAKPQASATER